MSVIPVPASASALEETLTRLTALAPLAATNRGPLPVDDPRRRAATEFTALLAAARADGVPISALVEATGSPWRTLKARLQRHQILSTPASIKTYQGIPYVRPVTQKCRREHEFTAENTFVYTDRAGREHRMCKRCRAERQAARRAELRAAATQHESGSRQGTASGTTSRLLVPTA